jgi:hypothetical protein
MAYGHAERTLATIRLLEAETRKLLSRHEQLDPEQAEWLRRAADSASRRLRSGGTVDTRITYRQGAGIGWPRCDLSSRPGP